MYHILLAITILFLSCLDAAAQVQVRGYTRKNGTYVAPYYRSSPNITKSDNWSTKGNVNPFTGKAGNKTPNAALAPAQSFAPGAVLPGSTPASMKNTPFADSADSGKNSAKAKPKEEAPRTNRFMNESAGAVLDERKSVLAYQERMAAKGNAQAQYTMALRYLYGIDVDKDESKASDYLKSSRDAGDLRARDKMIELVREKKKAEAELVAARESAALEMIRENGTESE